MNKPIKIIKFLCIGLFVYWIIGLLFSQIAYAQTVRTFTIVPPTIEQDSVQPGQRLEGTMKVINDSADSLTFQVDIQDFVVTDTNGTPNLLPAGTLAKKYSAASWIGVYPDSFSVAPHQKELLNYFVQIPLDARPGGHYGAVVFKPVGGNGENATGASVQTQIGSLFYLPVAGNIYEHADVTKLITDHPFYEYGPVNIATQITNHGDKHIKPLGTITITNMIGATVTTLPLDIRNIFPGAARDFQNTLSRHWMIGRYKVQLLASYGKSNNLPLIATVYFWVFPWKVAMIITLLIIALVLGWLYWRKKKTNNIQQPISNLNETTISSK